MRAAQGARRGGLEVKCERTLKRYNAKTPTRSNKVREHKVAQRNTDLGKLGQRSRGRPLPEVRHLRQAGGHVPPLSPEVLAHEHGERPTGYGGRRCEEHAKGDSAGGPLGPLDRRRLEGWDGRRALRRLQPAEGRAEGRGGERMLLGKTIEGSWEGIGGAKAQRGEEGRE
eukprot:7153034-Pyramimonas_sp.AAC.1